MRPLLLSLAFATPLAANDISLGLPIDCRLGDTCYIQSYVDADPAADAARDFTCGPRSYDTHKGTDFALPSLRAMQAGVAVIASAPGRIRATRDGMPDQIFTPERADQIDGRECGNGVVITHPMGWETQYCHLKQGSVSVSEGGLVAVGTPLGQVGLSGRTQFPHVHLTLRHNGRVVDPFAPNAAPDTCGPAGETLWATPLAYTPTGLIAAGFATAVPTFDAIKAGTAALPDLAADAPAIVLWTFAYGAMPGDRVTLTILDPTGQVIFDHDTTHEKQLAQYFRAGGKRIRAPLATGTYTGRIILARNGVEIDRTETTIPVR